MIGQPAGQHFKRVLIARLRALTQFPEVTGLGQAAGQLLLGVVVTPVRPLAQFADVSALGPYPRGPW